MDNMRKPTLSLAAYINTFMKHDEQVREPEFYVTRWIKRGRYPQYTQLVMDNYDFYCLFVRLRMDGVSSPYKKAVVIWNS